MEWTSVRTELIEGHHDTGEPLRCGSSEPFWIYWEALRRGRFIYCVNRRAVPKNYEITRRPRIAPAEAWVEVKNPVGTIGMIYLWMVSEVPAERYPHRSILPEEPQP